MGDKPNETAPSFCQSCIDGDLETVKRRLVPASPGRAYGKLEIAEVVRGRSRA